MAKTARYPTEAALCADFISWVKAEVGRFDHGAQTPVWTPYAETAGWDILLVAEDGTQIGVQAKLKFNLKVIAQTIPSCWDAWHDEGPDYRAVLVPENDGLVDQICAALGLTAFYSRGASWENRPSFGPGLAMEHWRGGWHFWSPRQRCKLPAFVPDVIAGASGPVQLTKWKVAALRIIARMDLRGFVTRQDFREIQIDPRRWTGPGGWSIPGAVPGQFARGPKLDFDRQHPVVYAAVLAEERKKFEKRGLVEPLPPGGAIQVGMETA